MGLFDLFKKKKKSPLQEYFNDVFENLKVVDVIATQDIPIIEIDGNTRRATANIYFRDFARAHPFHIDSFSKDFDAVLWIFDTIFVFELDANKDEKRRFIVMACVTSDGPPALSQHVDPLVASITILRLKEFLSVPVMDVAVFKEAWDFLVKNQETILEIATRKYSGAP